MNNDKALTAKKVIPEFRVTECSLCGLCAYYCKAGALKYYESIQDVVLTFGAEFCNGCGNCIRICPNHNIIYTESGQKVFIDSDRFNGELILHQSDWQKCSSCAKPFAPASLVNHTLKLLKLLNEGKPDESIYTLCVDCRSNMDYEKM